MAINHATHWIGTCDHCPAKCAEVYEQFPRCRECGDDVCPNCQHPGTFIEADGAPDARPDQYTAICKRCTPATGECAATATGYHRAKPGDICSACGYFVSEEDTRDAAYERANLEYAETHGGHL